MIVARHTLHRYCLCTLLIVATMVGCNPNTARDLGAEKREKIFGELVALIKKMPGKNLLSFIELLERWEGEAFTKEEKRNVAIKDTNKFLEKCRNRVKHEIEGAKIDLKGFREAIEKPSISAQVKAVYERIVQWLQDLINDPKNEKKKKSPSKELKKLIDKIPERELLSFVIPQYKWEDDVSGKADVAKQYARSCLVVYGSKSHEKAQEALGKFRAEVAGGTVADDLKKACKKMIEFMESLLEDKK